MRGRAGPRFPPAVATVPHGRFLLLSQDGGSRPSYRRAGPVRGAAEAQIADSFIRIGEAFFIGARRQGEVKANKLYLNHSCNPNLGFRGEIRLVAVRSIRVGEELT